jgi:methyl-accepting chemotaxis protein
MTQRIKMNRYLVKILSIFAEQAIGTENLNKAIMQIDQSTQGTASTTEELANTSQNLSTAAGSLAGHVKRFKVSEMSHPE